MHSKLLSLSKFLSNQNIHVIAAVLSIFPEWQKWNRENIVDYNEVYIKVPLDILEKRDTNNLYSQAKAGKIKKSVFSPWFCVGDTSLNIILE